MNNRLLGKMIEALGKKIASGECELSDAETEELLQLIAHERMYIPQLERHYGVTRRTIERWCEEGKLPPLRKDATGHKYLRRDELK